MSDYDALNRTLAVDAFAPALGIPFAASFPAE
jgi:hypothetical protein